MAALKHFVRMAFVILSLSSAVTFAALDGTCTENGNECDGIANAACIEDSGSSTCTCNVGFKKDEDVCVAKVLGDDCSGDTGCPGTNQACTSGKCACKAGFKADNTGDCLTKVTGLPCPSDCTSHLANTVCGTDNTCQCADGYETDTCVKASSGTDCSAGECTGTNQDCINGKCACNAGFKQDDSNECVTKVTGFPCDSNDKCTAHLDNSECGENGTCQCVSGYGTDTCVKNAVAFHSLNNLLMVVGIIVCGISRIW